MYEVNTFSVLMRSGFFSADFQHRTVFFPWMAEDKDPLRYLLLQSKNLQRQSNEAIKIMNIYVQKK